MKQKSNITSNAKIVSHLRKLWLQSRERSHTLQRDEYSCQGCGKKQSKAKGKEVSVVVHHIDEIDWEPIVKIIRQELLPDINKLQCLCITCHKNHHSTNKLKGK